MECLEASEWVIYGVIVAGAFAIGLLIGVLTGNE